MGVSSFPGLTTEDAKSTECALRRDSCPSTISAKGVIAEALPGIERVTYDGRITTLEESRKTEPHI